MPGSPTGSRRAPPPISTRRGKTPAPSRPGTAGPPTGPGRPASADLDSALLKGVTTITARPAVAALRGIDVSALRSSDIGIESKLSSELGRALLVLLGLD